MRAESPAVNTRITSGKGSGDGWQAHSKGTFPAYNHPRNK